MNDLHQSLDTTIAAIRAEHADAIRACNDRVLAAEVEATLLREQLTKANEARFAAERLSTKLITQFSVVEQVFAEAKALAQASYRDSKEGKTELPSNELKTESEVADGGQT